MSFSEKQKKLKLVIDLCQKHNISAYEIGKNTSLTDAGVHKILTGESKNPNHSSLNIMLKYVGDKITGSKTHDPSIDTSWYKKEQTPDASVEDIIAEKVLSKVELLFKDQDKKIADVSAILADVVNHLNTIKNLDELISRTTARVAIDLDEFKDLCEDKLNELITK